MMPFFKKDLCLVRRNAVARNYLPCPQSINYSVFLRTLDIKYYMLQQPHLSGQNLFINLFYIWDITAYSILKQATEPPTSLKLLQCPSYYLRPISILVIMILIRGPHIIMDIPVSSMMKQATEPPTSLYWRLQCSTLDFFGISVSSIFKPATEPPA